jgi:hypothetical protein
MSMIKMRQPGMRAWVTLLLAGGLASFTGYSTSATLHGHAFPAPGATAFAATWLAGAVILTAIRYRLLQAQAGGTS